MRKRPNHLESYGGKGTWALITGASDGIGLEFCKQLAQEGFNICLVSRSESKLKDAIKYQLSQYGVQTRYFVADFSGNANMAFYDDLMGKIADLDIGLVILNAGIQHSGWFWEESAEVWQQILDVNVYQYSALTHKLLAKLEAREAKRSGMIVVSSCAAELQGVIRNFVYGLSKVFVKYLVQAINYENSVKLA